jgi:hypothetical protein
MPLYMLIPHQARSNEDVRYFTTFASAEQSVFLAAQGYASRGEDPDWCTLVAYDGVDELHPVFLFTIIAPDRLRRDPYPSPSP